MQMPNGISVSAENSYQDEAITDDVMVEVEAPELEFRRVMRRWPDAADVELAGGRRGLWSLVSFAEMIEGAR